MSGGSFVVFAATVTSTGILPVEGLAVIFGVYRFMSMATAEADAALADGKLLPEDSDGALPHPAGIQVGKA